MIVLESRPALRVNQARKAALLHISEVKECTVTNKLRYIIKARRITKLW
jgi:hypothetical protein